MLVPHHLQQDVLEDVPPLHEQLGTQPNVARRIDGRVGTELGQKISLMMGGNIVKLCVLFQQQD